MSKRSGKSSVYSCSNGSQSKAAAAAHGAPLPLPSRSMSSAHIVSKYNLTLYYYNHSQNHIFISDALNEFACMYINGWR